LHVHTGAHACIFATQDWLNQAQSVVRTYSIPNQIAAKYYGAVVGSTTGSWVIAILVPLQLATVWSLTCDRLFYVGPWIDLFLAFEYITCHPALGSLSAGSSLILALTPAPPTPMFQTMLHHTDRSLYSLDALILPA
jgi:hypothetical protein